MPANQFKRSDVWMMLKQVVMKQFGPKMAKNLNLN